MSRLSWVNLLLLCSHHNGARRRTGQARHRALHPPAAEEHTGQRQEGDAIVPRSSQALAALLHPQDGHGCWQEQPLPGPGGAPHQEVSVRLCQLWQHVLHHV